MTRQKREANQALNMTMGKATRILRRMILLNLYKRLNKDICPKCGEKIKSYKDMSIGHKVPWRKCEIREGNADLFWDLNNIQIEHQWCNEVDSELW